MEYDVRFGVQLNLILVRTELVEYFDIKLVRKVMLFITYHYKTKPFHAVASYCPLS
jgi:hypothetical protein